MTHKEIAKIAHVSVSTVSKALSGSKDISVELTSQIRKLAIDMGYFKEKSKKNIENKKQQSVLIAIICPEINSMYYSQVIHQTKKEIESKSGQVAVYVYDFDQQKKDTIIEMLILRNCCDGIIVFGSYNAGSKPSIPIMCFDNQSDSEDCDSIYADYPKIFEDAVSYLKGLGHTKIGFIGESRTTKKRDIFISTLKNNGFETNDEYIYTIDKRFEEAGYAAAEKVINSQSRSTAFITAYDEIALGFIKKMVQNGFRIPEDISVMGINDISFSSYSSPSLTTVKIMFEEGLGDAINMLLDEIINNHPTGNKKLLDHKIIIRETTAEVKK